MKGGRGCLYDAICTLPRVGLGGVLRHHALGLHGEPERTQQAHVEPGTRPRSPALPALSTLLVAASVASVVGLLTWLSGPLLAATVPLSHLAPAAAPLVLFSDWTRMRWSSQCARSPRPLSEGSHGKTPCPPFPRMNGRGPKSGKRAGHGQEPAQFSSDAPDTHRHCSILRGRPKFRRPFEL